MKDQYGYTLPYPDSYYSSYGREHPVSKIDNQIAGIIERCQQTGQEIPQDHISELKRQAYELSG